MKRTYGGRYPEKIRKMIPDLTGCELIVLPSDGDFGFEDYLRDKTEYMIGKRQLYTTARKNSLLLRYPGPSQDEGLFQRFFASPAVRAEGGRFSGCFAVDITDYMGRTDQPAFRRLMSYMLEHREIHFLFLLFSPTREQITKTEHALSEYAPVDLLEFPYPDPAELSLHVINGYAEYLSDGLPEEAEECIEELLTGGDREYSFAERMVQELIDRECGTDPVLIQKTLSELVLREPERSEKKTFGFMA